MMPFSLFCVGSALMAGSPLRMGSTASKKCNARPDILSARWNYSNMYLSKELENAIRQGQVDAVQRVLEKGTPLAGYNPSGLVALGVAAAGHTAVVLALIVFGADPDEVDDEGDT